MKPYRKISALLITGLLFALMSCEKEPMDRFAVIHQDNSTVIQAVTENASIKSTSKDNTENCQPFAGPDIIMDTINNCIH